MPISPSKRRLFLVILRGCHYVIARATGAPLPWSRTATMIFCSGKLSAMETCSTSAGTWTTQPLRCTGRKLEETVQSAKSQWCRSGHSAAWCVGGLVQFYGGSAGWRCCEHLSVALLHGKSVAHCNSAFLLGCRLLPCFGNWLGSPEASAHLVASGHNRCHCRFVQGCGRNGQSRGNNFAAPVPDEGDFCLESDLVDRKDVPKDTVNASVEGWSLQFLCSTHMAR